jgi:hypothetical protein
MVTVSCDSSVSLQEYQKMTTKKPNPTEQRAIDRFEAKVESLVASGMARRTAVAEARRRHPDLHRQYVKATNKPSLAAKIDEIL